jgi:hypothetical protein
MFFIALPLHRGCRTGPFPPETAAQSEVKVLLPNKLVKDGVFLETGALPRRLAMPSLRSMKNVKSTPRRGEVSRARMTI